MARSWQSKAGSRLRHPLSAVVTRGFSVAGMALSHPAYQQSSGQQELSINPVFTREPVQLSRNELPPAELDPDTAYQVVHDELMLDGNARLNLATFVTTWMDPQATRLMTECFDKNMIDKDEYPRTAELELRCVRMLAQLWHAPPAPDA